MNKNIQNTFNMIANAERLTDFQTALEHLEALAVDEKKDVLDLVDATLIQQFLNEMPSHKDLQDVLMLSALIGEEPEENDLDILHGILLVADTIVSVKGEAASPILKTLIKKVSNLSDREYNNQLQLLKCIVESKEEAKVTIKMQPSNPFKGRNAF